VSEPAATLAGRHDEACTGRENQMKKQHGKNKHAIANILGHGWQ
jgi:hypothetical protein